MNIALDLGPLRLQSLRRDADQLIARRSRAVYAVLPDLPTQRSLLERAHIPYAACEGHLLLIGDAAETLARLFRVPCIDLLPQGQVPQADPIPRQSLAILIDALLPQAPAADAICAFSCSTAAAPLRRQDNGRTPRFFERLIELRGYRPLRISPGHALILAELGSAAFTGVGLVAGSTGCDLSITRCGREAWCGSIPYRRPWPAEFRHALLGGSADTSDSPVPARGDIRQRLALGRQFISDLVDDIAARLSPLSDVISLLRSQPLVCSGPLAEIPGFGHFFREFFRQHARELPVGDVRLSIDNPDTIARGCLISAELESQALQPQADAIRAA